MSATRLLTGCLWVGMVMTIAGAATHITGWALSPYILTVGGALMALSGWLTRHDDESLTRRRLWRQQSLASLFVVAAGILMLTTHGNEWIASLTIAAIIYLYTSLRLS